MNNFNRQSENKQNKSFVNDTEYYCCYAAYVSVYITEFRDN